ncbi:hypothetical protein JOD43_001928 [Pullulanibacillus pueri]|uniref:Lipoprotein n=1 Tax=Pullulanibacillus pueri TaxID=1437324 RepID=A0A8J2ZXV5_9BACL|nr:hypothetical protein [Pullulanibacillus pueri]MBM7681756.1 hypothetical protein [Pullulanibacillus pueri]GGH84149.1 lipoprotein [Pullulanibacillus pueri]
MPTIIKLLIPLCLLVLPLAGCGSNKDANKNSDQATESHEGTSQTNPNTGKSEAENQAKDTQNNADSQTGQSSSSDSSQDDQGDSSQDAHQSSPPKTIHQAMEDTAHALKTSVPLILPTDASLAEGTYLTSVTKSEKWFYQVKLYEVDQPTEVNSGAAGKGKSIGTVEGTEYKNSAAAKKAITHYYQVDQPNIDLGHNIKGESSAGAGHSYIIWNEGRWSLSIDTPTDPANQTTQFDTGKTLAKEIVDYLESHTLPAPQSIGSITVHAWKDSPSITVFWQNHEMTYKISSQTDPLGVLKLAVSMKAF